jgi:hypothetical protein
MRDGVTIRRLETDVQGVARVDGEWMVLELEPGSVRHLRLDRYRGSLLSLGSTVESMLA